MTCVAIPRVRPALLAALIPASLLALAACAAQLQQGEALMASGRWDEAVAYYLKAVERNRSDPEARASLFRALAEASIHYQRLGEEAERAGKIEEAKQFYERCLAYNSENPTARAGLTRIANREKALAAVTRGQDLLTRKANREALREAEIALELVPDLPQAKQLLEKARAALGREAPGQKDGDALALFPDRPVTLRFRDTDIKEVLEVFARLSTVNIFTDDAVGPKRITANFRDLPIREAFRLILSSNRFFAKQVAPNTVVVVPDNPGKRQQYEDLFVKTFYLVNADAKVAVNLVRTILNTRQIFVNEKLNALVVRDTPQKLELARKLLEANDRGTAEVEVELEVLEVDRDRVQNLGVVFNDSLTATLQVPSTRIGGMQFVGFFRAGVLSITNPQLTLNLVKTLGDTRILAHPTIRVLDRQKARLLIGQRFPFQISQLSSVPATAGAAGTTPVAPTGAVTTTETRVEYRDVGLKLTLTPTIHLNGEVTVEINFEISAIAAGATSVTGTATPTVNTRNMDSFIKVRDGETRLLGGLFQDNDIETTRKIPFLGDLPAVGRVLFSNVNSEKRRTDVLVAVTPRLVKVIDRPGSEIEQFFSGTAEAFGGVGVGPLPPLPPTLPPTPPTPPRAPGAPGPPGGSPFPGVPPGVPGPPPPPPGSPPSSSPAPGAVPAASAPESGEPAAVPGASSGEQPPAQASLSGNPDASTGLPAPAPPAPSPATSDAAGQPPAPRQRDVLPPPPPFPAPGEVAATAPPAPTPGPAPLEAASASATAKQPETQPPGPPTPAPREASAAAAAPAAPPAPPSGPRPRGGLSFQVAAFQDAGRAQAYVEELRGRGLPAFSAPAEVLRKDGAGRWVRVFVGPFASEEAAEAARLRLPQDRAAAAKLQHLPYAVELGPVPSPEWAARLVTRAKDLGYAPTVLQAASPGGQAQFRVRLDGFRTAEDAQAMARELQAAEAATRPAGR